jgi:hypothetical protein
VGTYTDIFSVALQHKALLFTRQLLRNQYYNFTFWVTNYNVVKMFASQDLDMVIVCCLCTNLPIQPTWQLLLK